jgi:hypothetical protein
MLPVGHDDVISAHLSKRAEIVPGLNRSEPIRDLAQLASDNGSAVLLLIDGINESLDPIAFSTALFSFLSSVDLLSIRVLITCRDEYWSVFSPCASQCSTVIHGTLGMFTVKERNSAIQKYFSHYKITAELKPEPRNRLADPLLLRFFCEAYGRRNDELAISVEHIRLMPLFEEYRRIKFAQIAEHLRTTRSVDSIIDYVSRIGAVMLNGASSSVNRNALRSIIPERDLVNVGSLYARLLDEDIILEQRYVESANSVVVSFTYEAFMEFTLGETLSREWFERSEHIGVFLTEWRRQHESLPNAVGILGFLFALVYQHRRAQFLSLCQWVVETDQDLYLYSLRIAFDNLPPEQFKKEEPRLLLSRIHREGLRAFSPKDTVRVLLRAPSSLSAEFGEALAEGKFDTTNGIRWPDVLAHFGQTDSKLLWQALRLYFYEGSQPLFRLTAVRANAFLRRLREAKHGDYQEGAETVREIVSRWNSWRAQIEENGRWGGWDRRARAVDELVGYLRDRDSTLPDLEP